MTVDANALSTVTVTAWRRAAFAMFAVGWGANHFTALLPVYRRTLGLPDTTLTAIFGVYLFGLAPGLLLGGPISDRYGRRPVLLVSVGLSLVGSLVLIAGTRGVTGLYAGRLLTGVAAGGTFAAGSAWVKELSARADEGAGARRAAISLSAGFGSGPLVAGLLAQWGPAPTVLPYLLHIALAVSALVVLRRAPETVGEGVVGTQGRLLTWRRVSAASSPRFVHVVLPMAPWVFGCATIAFAVLPARVAAHVGHVPIAFAGAIAALTLGAGIVVQPLARRLDSAGNGRGMAAGLGVAALGCIVGATATATSNPVIVAVAALVLGSAYGLCLVSGLREVERLAAPSDLAGLVAVYYVLAYGGFAAPYLLALLAPALGYPSVLLMTALLATVTLLLVLIQAKRLIPPIPQQ